MQFIDRQFKGVSYTVVYFRWCKCLLLYMFMGVDAYGCTCSHVYMFMVYIVTFISFLMYTVQDQCTLQVCTSYPSFLTVALQDTEQWVLPPDAGDLSEWPLAVHQANFSADFSMLMKTVWKRHTPDVFTWLGNTHLVLWMFNRQKKVLFVFVLPSLLAWNLVDNIPEKYMLVPGVGWWQNGWSCTRSQIPLLSWIKEVLDPFFYLHEYFLMNVNLKLFYIQGVFFFCSPPILTKSQAHYKFLYLENFGGGQFKLYRAWDLVKFRGEQKKTLCI